MFPLPECPAHVPICHMGSSDVPSLPPSLSFLMGTPFTSSSRSSCPGKDLVQTVACVVSFTSRVKKKKSVLMTKIENLGKNSSSYRIITTVSAMDPWAQLSPLLRDASPQQTETSAQLTLQFSRRDNEMLTRSLRGYNSCIYF